MLFRSNDTATTEIYTQRYTLSLHDAPDLQREDISEALRYAADAVRERELPLTVP